MCLLRCVLLVLCAVYLIGEVECRGGRGGGGRGRSSFRSSSRYRSRGGVRTSRRFPSGWKIAAGAGLIYGYSSYTHRSSYYRNPNREPNICENRYDFLRPNGTSYAYFICPLSNQSDSHTYCCGSSQRQHCCRFWDSGGRVAGVVIGILFGVAIFATMIYCCCCKRAGNDGKTIMQRRITQNGHAKQPARQPGAAIPLAGPHMGVNYPQPAAQPLGPTAEPLFPVEPNPLGPQPYPTQPPYPSPSGYPPQSTYPTNSINGPPYPAAASGPPYPPAAGRCPYPVGPPMSENNYSVPPCETNPPYPNKAPPQECAPVPVSGQPFGEPVPTNYGEPAFTPYGVPASAPPPSIPVSDGSYPQAPPPPYPGGR